MPVSSCARNVQHVGGFFHRHAGKISEFHQLIDIGRPSRAVPVTPPGIRVTYHGGSIELSVLRRGYAGETKRVEIGVPQGLLDRRMA